MTNITILVSLLLGLPQVRCGKDGLNSLVRDQLFNEAVRLDRAADAAWTACRTQEELAARRSEDVALAARAFADLAGVKRVALEAVGAAAIPAAHAYFLERAYFASFASEATPPAWRKVLSDPEIPFAFADTVHGALRFYDWVDLVR